MTNLRQKLKMNPSKTCIVLERRRLPIQILDGVKSQVSGIPRSRTREKMLWQIQNEINEPKAHADCIDVPMANGHDSAVNSEKKDGLDDNVVSEVNPFHHRKVAKKV